jgi:hypothetical protein
MCQFSGSENEPTVPLCSLGLQDVGEHWRPREHALLQLSDITDFTGFEDLLRSTSGISSQESSTFQSYFFISCQKICYPFAISLLTYSTLCKSSNDPSTARVGILLHQHTRPLNYSDISSSTLCLSPSKRYLSWPTVQPFFSET